MFNVTFYSFSKKLNSTARPTGAGTTYACKAKGPFDKLSPVLELQIALSTIPTFNYASFDGRFYRVTAWTNDGPLWACSLQIDALATWKTSIGAQSIYVFRSATSYDGDIVDTLYPPIAKYRRFRVTLPRMWTLDAASALAAQGTGLFVLGIAGEGQTRFYGFTATNLDTFLSNLFSPTYYNEVLGEFGATEYPEAKVAVNPLQYVSSIRFFPCGFGVPGTAWALHVTGSVSSIPVGPVAVAGVANIFTAVGAYPDQTSYNSTYFDVDISGTDFRHPQADERGDFLQLNPFTSYEAVIPPWGIVQIDSADLLEADYLRVRITVDIRSGSGVLTLSALHGTREVVLCRSTAQVGIECPLSQVVTPGASTLSIVGGVASTLLSAVSGNVVGAVSGLHNTIGSAVSGSIPHLSVVGSQGSGAAMAGDPHLSVTHRYLAPDDLAGRGRPLCQVRRIDTIPGYIMGDPDEISLACTPSELSTIRAAVAGGFFYE